MYHLPSKANKLARITTIGSLAFMACWGLLLVFAKMKPFWTDEWRLIYNIKFKSPESLWGPLDFTQQFPRVYLQLLKAVTSWFQYSYFILRFPSFLVGIATMLFSYRLMNKIYKPVSLTRFFFVFLIVSSVTFTDYFVQIKQYTMEIFLSVVAVWQMVEIIGIGKGVMPGRLRYILLCISLFAAPFFSYTYPIAAAPVFMVAAFQALLLLRSGDAPGPKWRILLRQWAPLALSAVGIILFYKIDVSKVMGDTEMHGYWNYRMITGCNGFVAVAGKLWDFFAQAGSGFVFEIIFGILGVCAVARASWWWLRNLAKPGFEMIDLLRLYSLLVVAMTVLLFFAGKIPIEPKFNAFATPSRAILIIGLMDYLLTNTTFRKAAGALIAVLYLELAGNLLTTALNLVTAPEYAQRINTYKATEKAIQQASQNNLPIFVTAGVAFPDAINDRVPFFEPISAASVLKTFPAYSNVQKLPVYSLLDLSDIKVAAKNLPDSVKTAMVGDGLIYNAVEIKK